MKVNALRLLLVCLFAFSASVSFSEDTPLQKFCKESHPETDELSQEPPSLWQTLDYLYQYMKVISNPLATFETRSVEMRQSKEHWVRPASGTKLPTRNLIFTVGAAPDAKLDPAGLEELMDRYQRDIERARDLRDAPTYASCLRMGLEMGFDPDVRNRAFANEFESHRADQYELHRSVVMDALRPVLRKSILDWEVIPYVDVDEVIQAMRSPDVANVVLIQHSYSSGVIVDAWKRSFKSGSFKSISPNLLSFGFYSCNGDRLVKFYELDQAMQNRPSYYPTRYFFFPEENPIRIRYSSETAHRAKKGDDHDSQENSGNVAWKEGFQSPSSPANPNLSNVSDSGERYRGRREAILQGAGQFLQTIDRTVAPMMKVIEDREPEEWSNQPEEKPVPTCGLKIQGFEMLTGSFGLLLNGRFIRTITAGKNTLSDGSYQFSFPCDYFDSREKDVLLIQNMYDGMYSDAKIHEFTATWEGEIPNHSSPQVIKHYCRYDVLPETGPECLNLATDTYSSSKIVWTR